MTPSPDYEAIREALITPSLIPHDVLEGTDTKTLLFLGFLLFMVLVGLALGGGGNQ